jgi:hypothetical protein
VVTVISLAQKVALATQAFLESALRPDTDIKAVGELFEGLVMATGKLAASGQIVLFNRAQDIVYNAEKLLDLRSSGKNPEGKVLATLSRRMTKVANSLLEEPPCPA